MLSKFQAVLSLYSEEEPSCRLLVVHYSSILSLTLAGMLKVRFKRHSGRHKPYYDGKLGAEISSLQREKGSLIPGSIY
jgi:hypothetical protein